SGGTGGRPRARDFACGQVGSSFRLTVGRIAARGCALRIGILSSGGDAPGMNAAIRAVTRKAIFEGHEVFGIRQGFDGLMNGNLQAMDRSSVGDIIHRGGTILFSGRSERFLTTAGQAEAVRKIRAFGLDGLVVLGGGGSLRGALALARRGVAVCGIPATIDNDV